MFLFENSVKLHFFFCFDFKVVKEYCSFPAEYIVAFKGYYRQEARERFIEAALNDSDVVRWEVMPRNNPASDYPSDFDVVQVSCLALRTDSVFNIERLYLENIESACHFVLSTTCSYDLAVLQLYLCLLDIVA